MRLDLLPECKNDLSDLDFTNWKKWPAENGLVRQLDETRYVAIVPFLFTWGLIVGNLSDRMGYHSRYCYHSLEKAVIFGTIWNGEGDPDGWHRHTPSHRRRPDGDPEKEYIDP